MAVVILIVLAVAFAAAAVRFGADSRQFDQRAG